MKIIINTTLTVIMAVWASLGAKAQSYVLQYQYDAAGNRIARVIAQPQQPQNSPRMMGHGGEVTVSPTVTTDNVTISTTRDPEQTQMSYVLSNLQGSVLATGDILSQQTIISLRQYSNGIYLLSVRSNDEVKTFKIIRL